MNTGLKIIIAILLLFNCVGAIYGGLNLVIYPDGSSIGLSLKWLTHTPFTDYLVPGIILFIANGLFSIFPLLALMFNFRYGAVLVALQGIILTGWIVIEIFLMRTVHSFHIILGSAGIILITGGYFLKRLQNLNAHGVNC